LIRGLTLKEWQKQVLKQKGNDKRRNTVTSGTRKNKEKSKNMGRHYK